MATYNVGKDNPMWNGGLTIDSRRRKLILKHAHPRANPNGYIFEHILIAEKALGKNLPKKAVVHHANEINNDNRNENLIICEDNNYHKLLHKRKRAFDATGNPKWVKCVYCGEWDDPKNMSIYERRKYSNKYIHKRCNRTKMSKWRKMHPKYWKKFC